MEKELKQDIKKIEMQKVKMKRVIVGLLNSEIALFDFEHTLMENEQDKKACKKLIQDSKKAIEIVNNIQHIEILASLFNTFVGKKEVYFIQLSHSIVKNVKKWDTTKVGFKAFLELEKQAKDKYEQEQLEKQKTKEIIEKAKEEGKKVEMVYENGKIKPIIVEQKTN